MFALLRFEIFGTGLCEDVKNAITPDLLPALFKLSKKHELAHLAADALIRNGLLPENSEGYKRFSQERSMAIYRREQQQYEYERICQALEEAQISFLPLKGNVVRKYYPEPWQRTSCDIDILVPAAELERSAERLHAVLGYTIGEKTVNDLSLYAPSGVHLELHYDLTECGRFQDGILSDIWQYASPKRENSCHFVLTNEALYFYHIAHMVKHFEDGGCGVRPFLDLFLLHQKAEIDGEKRDELLQKGGFLTFARACEKLSAVWFGNEKTDALSAKLERYTLTGGAYGTLQNRVSVQQAKKGSKFKYILSRIFISNKELKLKYPALEKRPYLAPFYHIKRWCKPLTQRESGKQSLHELSQTTAVESDAKEENARLLKELGLQ